MSYGEETALGDLVRRPVDGILCPGVLMSFCCQLGHETWHITATDVRLRHVPSQRAEAGAADMSINQAAASSSQAAAATILCGIFDA